jgi:hypothetical protein
MQLLGSKLVLLAAAGLMVTVACSDEHPPPVTEVTTSVGHTVTVTLATTGAGGFQDPVFSSPVVRMVDASSISPQGTESLRQAFRFEALAKGRAEILFHHTVLADKIVAIVVSD